MTDSNRSANELPALLEERRKYESWLAALEARREATPQHVFDRVKADYDGRMRQVESRLAAHRQSIQDERASLASRRALLEAEEQLRRDERAELELRAHVGELAGDDADAAFKAVDDALGGMREEKATLSQRIGELDALLELRASGGPVAEPAADASAAPSTPEIVREDTELSSSGDEQESSSSTAASGQAAGGKETLRTPGGSFDELAFLTDVVGLKNGATADGPGIVRDEPASESILDGIVPSAERTSERAPLASNVPGNTPIILKTTGGAEQVKTLKCTECGAMNYPTEWYCERCGAELAAL